MMQDLAWKTGRLDHVAEVLKWEQEWGLAFRSAGIQNDRIAYAVDTVGSPGTGDVRGIPRKVLDTDNHKADRVEEEDTVPVQQQAFLSSWLFSVPSLEEAYSKRNPYSQSWHSSE